MELIDLKAELRNETGKGVARALRRNERIPAIVYGAKIDPVMLSVESTEFDKVVRDTGFQGVFLNLNVDGEDKKSRTVVLKDVQMDVFHKEYLHIDFHEIDMENKVTVSVQVITTGTAKGVKEGGGVLQIIRRELDVVCKPVDVPDAITVDVSALDIGDAVHVSEIDLDENIEIPHEVDFTVITLVPPTAEEAVEEDEDLLDAELADTDDGDEETKTEEASEEESS